MIAKFENRIVKAPLPLPPRINPDAIKDFDYRRVYATGLLRHDQEMLIGPRVHDGKNGYLVVTPLQREGSASTILVNRGWIPKKLKSQIDRKDGLPEGFIKVEGLLRQPWKKNMFTPDKKPELGEFYFPDVEQMALFTGSDPIWVEETMRRSCAGLMFTVAKGLARTGPREGIRQRSCRHSDRSASRSES